MLVILNREDVENIFHSVDWKMYEVTAFRNYCMVSSISDITELSYIILSMIHDSYTGETTQFIFDMPSSTTLSFVNMDLVVLSQSMFDDLVYMIEEDVRLDRSITHEVTGESPPTSFEIEEFYDRCVELYIKLLSVVLGSVMDRENHYRLNCYKGSLICSDR